MKLVLGLCAIAGELGVSPARARLILAAKGIAPVVDGKRPLWAGKDIMAAFAPEPNGNGKALPPIPATTTELMAIGGKFRVEKADAERIRDAAKAADKGIGYFLIECAVKVIDAGGL